MSFLAAKKSSPQTAAIWPAYTGLQLQTATNTLPIPLLWGMSKLAVNIFFYANFRAIPVYTPRQSAGKGAIFGGRGRRRIHLVFSGWNYTADLMMALCEGPIVGVNQVWQGQSTYGDGQFDDDGRRRIGRRLGAVLARTHAVRRRDAQAPWGYLAANYPSAKPRLSRHGLCLRGEFRSRRLGQHRHAELRGARARSSARARMDSTPIRRK